LSYWVRTIRSLVQGFEVIWFTYKHDIVGNIVRRNGNIFVMKRGKTLNSFLVFKYRLRSTINTSKESEDLPIYIGYLNSIRHHTKKGT
jgi:hypothetical protein